MPNGNCKRSYFIQSFSLWMSWIALHSSTFLNVFISMRKKVSPALDREPSGNTNLLSWHWKVKNSFSFSYHVASTMLILHRLRRLPSPQSPRTWCCEHSLRYPLVALNFCCFSSFQLLNPICKEPKTNLETIKSELKRWALIQYGSASHRFTINCELPQLYSWLFIARTEIHKANLLKLKSHKILFLLQKTFMVATRRNTKKN